MSRILITGADSLVGSVLARKLEEAGFELVSVALKHPEEPRNCGGDLVIGDLREASVVESVFAKYGPFGRIYHLAADSGGADYIHSHENDLAILENSMKVHLNLLDAIRKHRVKRLMLVSSAAVYPAYNQFDAEEAKFGEETVYPAAPGCEHGWERLFAERLFSAAARSERFEFRIARLFNTYGPGCEWQGGRESVVGALCRKVAAAYEGDSIPIYGDGKQMRSFLYVDDAASGLMAHMDSEVSQALNIGSVETIDIIELAQKIIKISGKKLKIKLEPGPLGVRFRRSDNSQTNGQLGWGQKVPLNEGLQATYEWVSERVDEQDDEMAS